MKTTIGLVRVRSALAAILASAFATALPIGVLPFAAVSEVRAQAVSESNETRLRRIEAELRAVQRRVFPDGAGKAFGAEISPPVGAMTSTAPATSAVTDLLTRMDAVESQLQRLTAASEENQNHLSKLDARMVALEASSSSSASVVGSGAAAQSAVPALTAPSSTNIDPPKMPAKPAPKPVAKPDAGRSEAAPDRVAAVLAVEKPASDDKGEDEYTYGYRLWEAKFFPEAQQQLLRVVQQFPRHTRISYARNLLGRAYLDDAKPGTAAQYFLQNYQADRKGDRAADSLLYLGVAMIRLKEEKRACVAFAEFSQTYAAETVGRLKNQYEAGIKPVTCN